MLHSKMRLIAPLMAMALLVTQTAGAVGVRLDSGDWDTVFSGSSTTNANVGFTLDFEMNVLGISGSQVNVSSAGQVRLLDGQTADFADFNPFRDFDQVGDGNTTQFSLEETNAAFSQAGVNAGFRATWSALDGAGALANVFQMAFFELTDGQYAVEFNYDLLTVGDGSTSVGYSTSLGTSFDLLAAIGVPIGDALGAGDFDPTFPDLCLSTPMALACNNYYNGAFGASDQILPATAGGYFRTLSGTDPTPVQGRYLFLFGDAVAVAEPTGLLLVGIGALAMGLARRRRR